MQRKKKTFEERRKDGQKESQSKVKINKINI